MLFVLVVHRPCGFYILEYRKKIKQFKLGIKTRLRFVKRPHLAVSLTESAHQTISIAPLNGNGQSLRQKVPFLLQHPAGSTVNRMKR